jgi:hypothetical protein
MHIEIIARIGCRKIGPFLDRPMSEKGVKGGGAEDARVRSAYPPKLSVKADIPARQPNAMTGLMHRNKVMIIRLPHQRGPEE